MERKSEDLLKKIEAEGITLDDDMGHETVEEEQEEWFYGTE